MHFKIACNDNCDFPVCLRSVCKIALMSVHVTIWYMYMWDDMEKVINFVLICWVSCIGECQNLQVL